MPALVAIVTALFFILPLADYLANPIHDVQIGPN